MIRVRRSGRCGDSHWSCRATSSSPDDLAASREMGFRLESRQLSQPRRTLTAPAATEELIDDHLELLEVYGLGKVCIEPGFFVPIDILVLAKSRQSDRGN